VDLEEAVRTRRTHKSFGPDPVPRETLDELFELARWAPNHHLTQPWRFRVLGSETLARLKEAGGPTEALKLDRAPTLVVASAKLSGDLVQDEEDLHATACAVYAVLLGALAFEVAIATIDVITGNRIITNFFLLAPLALAVSGTPRQVLIAGALALVLLGRSWAREAGR
jgi:nitroreductase